MGRISKLVIGACLILFFVVPAYAELFTLLDLSCNCQTTFEEGTVVTLTATPDPDSVFVGWSGACTGSQKTCKIVMDGDKKVNAKFNKKPTKPVWRRTPKATM
jgi:uncharacterized repeat protein (TIGR02543 family)